MDRIDRETGTHADRKRVTERKTWSETDRQTDRQRHRDRDRQRQTDRDTETDRDREMEREETDRQTDRDRQKETETDRDKVLWFRLPYESLCLGNRRYLSISLRAFTEAPLLFCTLKLSFILCDKRQ